MQSVDKKDKECLPPITQGSRFGRLTVLCDSGKRKNGYKVWRCQCDCGGIIDVDMRTLRRGTVSDCGCVTKVSSCQRDITDQRFGKLTAKYCTEKKDSNGSYYWHCICDCGQEIDVSLHQLQSGYRKSCGCLSHPPLKDFVGKRFGKLVVTEYAGKVNGIHRWKCVCDCGNEVTVSQTHLQNGKTKSCGCIQTSIYLQNMKFVDGTSVTALESSRRRLRSTNTSGRTGVYWNKELKMWDARIGFRNKQYYLGTYRNKSDAIEARERGEEMHEEFLDWYYHEYLPDSKPQIDKE